MNSYIVSFLVGTGVTNIFPVIMGLYCLYYGKLSSLAAQERAYKGQLVSLLAVSWQTLPVDAPP